MENLYLLKYSATKIGAVYSLYNNKGDQITRFINESLLLKTIEYRKIQIEQIINDIPDDILKKINNNFLKSYIIDTDTKLINMNIQEIIDKK